MRLPGFPTAGASRWPERADLGDFCRRSAWSPAGRHYAESRALRLARWRCGCDCRRARSRGDSDCANTAAISGRRSSAQSAFAQCLIWTVSTPCSMARSVGIDTPMRCAKRRIGSSRAMRAARSLAPRRVNSCAAFVMETMVCFIRSILLLTANPGYFCIAFVLGLGRHPPTPSGCSLRRACRCCPRPPRNGQVVAQTNDKTRPRDLLLQPKEITIDV